MEDAVANYEAARDALNAKIYEGRPGDDSPDLQRSLETLINSLEILNPWTPLRPLVREEAQRRAERGEDVDAEILIERFIEAGLADRDGDGDAADAARD